MPGESEEAFQNEPCYCAIPVLKRAKQAGLTFRVYTLAIYIHKYIFSPIKKNKELYGWCIYIYMVIFVSDAVPLDAGQVVDGENRNIITRNDTATTKNKVGK